MRRDELVAYRREPPNTGSRADIVSRVKANCALVREVELFDEDYYIGLSFDVVLHWRYLLLGRAKKASELDDIVRVIDRSTAAYIYVRVIRFWLPFLWWRVRIAADR